ncbi:conserved hypothetical protein [Trichinella spiralis]|uniref:hypothetical protein n=1 Tax=Trichinella spiralis TaxID=6334 RepID=UPI0001EFE78E|nr:conserved hypothetical protein [Trichinella spiralis]
MFDKNVAIKIDFYRRKLCNASLQQSFNPYNLRHYIFALHNVLSTDIQYTTVKVSIQQACSIMFFNIMYNKRKSDFNCCKWTKNLIVLNARHRQTYHYIMWLKTFHEVAVLRI